jgi:catechol 2,3-dioxygenase-like lactoylglutathione lyase family enzyme
MTPHLRVARPVGSLERSAAMYRDALGLRVLGRFEDHAGFDGVMLGLPGAPYHFEFTRSRTDPVAPTPTPEDLLVLYLPDVREWQRRCEAMRAAGFSEVSAFNPYWQRQGCTFADPDGYRIVLQNAPWPEGAP